VIFQLQTKITQPFYIFKWDKL